MHRITWPVDELYSTTSKVTDPSLSLSMAMVAANRLMLAAKIATQTKIPSFMARKYSLISNLI
jgi:hypothetical protein